MRIRVIAFMLCIGASAGGVSVEAGTSSEQAQQPSTLTHREAQPTGPPVTLTVLLEEAIERNPELVALRAQVDVVRQRPGQERFLDAPMAEAQIWQWPFNSINPADTNMYMLMVTQDLPGRGKRDLRAAVAEKDVALAGADVAVRTREIINQVKQAYASLYIARKAIRVHLDSIELLRQITDIAQAKYAAGRISQQDVLKPTVELSRLHGAIITFDEQARLASARLNILRNLPPETPIGPLIEPREQTILPTSADLQRLALERQPELQRAGIEIERAEAELAAARSEYKPDFSIQGGYMLMPRMTDAWMARVGITWPRAPWSRGRIDARVAEHSAAIQAAKARLQVLENVVRLGVQEAYVRARSAQDRAAIAANAGRVASRLSDGPRRVSGADRQRTCAARRTARVLPSVERLRAGPRGSGTRRRRGPPRWHDGRRDDEGRTLR